MYIYNNQFIYVFNKIWIWHVTLFLYFDLERVLSSPNFEDRERETSLWHYIAHNFNYLCHCNFVNIIYINWSEFMTGIVASWFSCKYLDWNCNSVSITISNQLKLIRITFELIIFSIYSIFNFKISLLSFNF